MTPQPSTKNDKSEDLTKDLIALAQAIGSLPDEYRGQIEPVFARVAEGAKRRRRILTLVQEALSQLRLDMKYLVFDLEATRRERDAYRESLDGE